MSEWHIVSVLVGFVIGFLSGVTYALRLYKQMEANSDREWAKRHGMPEMKTQGGDLRVQINPIFRRHRL